MKKRIKIKISQFLDKRPNISVLWNEVEGVLGIHVFG